MAAIFLVFLLIFTFIFMFLWLPIMIANGRGIVGNRKTTIVLLSILGIFCGVTWLIAMVLALVWPGAEDCNHTTDLDSLEKLAKLYKSKSITKSEYEKMKAKILGK